MIESVNTITADQLISALKMRKKALKIVNFQINGVILEIVWASNGFSLNADKINELIDSVISIFQEIQISPNQICAFCGENGATETVFVDGVSLFKAHAHCKTEKIAEYEASVKNQPVEKPNYVGGLLGAIIGAIIGTIPWIIVELSVGFYAAALGLLIGYSSFFFYKKFGGPLNSKAKIIIALATIIGVLFTNIFLASYIIYNSDGALVFENYVIVYTDPEIGRALISSLFLGLIMGGLALPSIINKVKSEEKRKHQIE